MRRKAILIFAALLMVVSGVAAVSAYEAHAINVTATVENALEVDTAAIGFGTVFPQEWLIEDRDIALSSSANDTLGSAAGTLLDVDYEIWAEYKVESAGTPPAYYIWLGEWLWVGIDATTPSGSSMAGWTQVGVQPDPGYANDGTAGTPADMADPVTGVIGTLNAGNKDDTLRVMILAPCFHTYYNADTDTKPDWWPTPDTAAYPLLDQALHDGVNLGLNLKIQVTDIGRN